MKNLNVKKIKKTNSKKLDLTIYKYFVSRKAKNKTFIILTVLYTILVLFITMLMNSFPGVSGITVYISLPLIGFYLFVYNTIDLNTLFKDHLDNGIYSLEYRNGKKFTNIFFERVLVNKTISFSMILIFTFIIVISYVPAPDFTATGLGMRFLAIFPLMLFDVLMMGLLLLFFSISPTTIAIIVGMVFSQFMWLSPVYYIIIETTNNSMSALGENPRSITYETEVLGEMHYIIKDYKEDDFIKNYAYTYKGISLDGRFEYIGSGGISHFINFLSLLKEDSGNLIDKDSKIVQELSKKDSLIVKLNNKLNEKYVEDIKNQPLKRLEDFSRSIYGSKDVKFLESKWGAAGVAKLIRNDKDFEEIRNKHKWLADLLDVAVKSIKEVDYKFAGGDFDTMNTDSKIRIRQSNGRDNDWFKYEDTTNSYVSDTKELFEKDKKVSIGVSELLSKLIALFAGFNQPDYFKQISTYNGEFTQKDVDSLKSYLNTSNWILPLTFIAPLQQTLGLENAIRTQYNTDPTVTGAEVYADIYTPYINEHGSIITSSFWSGSEQDDRPFAKYTFDEYLPDNGEIEYLAKANYVLPMLMYLVIGIGLIAGSYFIMRKKTFN